jgi:NTE family protein
MINPFKYMTKRKMGLVLGSGGAKGLAHISTIEYLENMEIPVHLMVGSSIGAIIGAVYAAGNLKRMKTDLLNFDRSRVISLMDPVFPRSGLIEGKEVMKFMMNYIPRDLNLEDLPFPFAVVATDYYNAGTVVFTRGNVLEAVRASISIPGIFIPVKYRDTFLIDGGVSNPLPVNVAKRMGASVTIAVNLNGRVYREDIKDYYRSFDEETDMVLEPKDIEILEEESSFRMDDSSPKGGSWLGTVNHWLRMDRSSGYPNIFEVITRSIDIMGYVNTRLVLKYTRPTVLIEPDVLQFGVMEFNRASQILTEGFLATDAKRSELKSRVKNWL